MLSHIPSPFYCEIGSRGVAQAGLQLAILLSQVAEITGERHRPGRDDFQSVLCLPSSFPSS